MDHGPGIDHELAKECILESMRSSWIKEAAECVHVFSFMDAIHTEEVFEVLSYSESSETRISYEFSEALMEISLSHSLTPLRIILSNQFRSSKKIVGKINL